MAFAMSLASARVGMGRSIMDSSIWVAVMAGTPAWFALVMMCFCRQGHTLGGYLHTEVSARDHHRVRCFHDVVEVIDGHGMFDLGDDGR